MNIEIKEQNGTYVGILSGWLDTNAASQFMEDIKVLEENIDKSIVLDCKNLEYICSLALRGLLKLKKESADKGGRLVLRNVEGEVRHILTLTGRQCQTPTGGYLILEIDALDAVGNTREDLVWDGIKGIAEDGDGQVLAKDLHLIALHTGNIRHVDHRYIHADVTHVLRLLTVHQTIAVTITQMAIQAIGIANRNGSND